MSNPPTSNLQPPTIDLRPKRITITGGKGFLGQHLIRTLQSRRCRHLSIADLPEYNLVNLSDIRRMYEEQKPDIVIHLAAKVGGIGFNQQNPASLFYENAMMGIQLMHEGYLRNIEKFVALGTICAYPKFTPVPFKEDDIWNGYPEETNAPYGLAKKMMLVQSQAYRQQYDFNSIFLLPVNLYGPGDNFSFKSSHVIPALIRKFHLANLLSRGDFTGIIDDFLRNNDGELEVGGKRFEVKPDSPVDEILAVLKHFGISYSSGLQPSASNLSPSPSGLSPTPSVEIWGTGSATREFFYVKDAAQAIALATENYDKPDPVNIGAGFEISIKDLVNVIIDLIGFKGSIVWNTSKPDGQPRRMLDTNRAMEEFGFQAKTPFIEGLRKTIDWYVSTGETK
ncbi:MAG: GDP-L-fucose synthase [Syntrophorhabdaceae bacterium]|nr:GDP-L-fucose synthase [Syntrophorhabdaceae bacterium]